MVINPHFVSILISDVFKGKQFKGEDHFCAQVIQTGIWLGTIMVYGFDFPFRIPGYDGEQQIINSLSLPYQPVDMFDCSLVVSDSIKKPWTSDGWFKKTTLRLVELSPFDFYSKAEKIALSSGSTTFIKSRKNLNLVVDVASKATVRQLRKMDMNPNSDVQLIKFSALLSDAWKEHNNDK